MQKVTLWFNYGKVKVYNVGHGVFVIKINNDCYLHEIFNATNNCQLKIIADFNCLYYRLASYNKINPLEEALKILKDITEAAQVTLCYFSLLKNYLYLKDFENIVSKYFDVITVTDFIKTNASIQKHFLVKTKRVQHIETYSPYIFYNGQLYEFKTKDDATFFNQSVFYCNTFKTIALHNLEDIEVEKRVKTRINYAFDKQYQTKALMGRLKKME